MRIENEIDDVIILYFHWSINKSNDHTMSDNVNGTMADSMDQSDCSKINESQIYLKLK